METNEPGCGTHINRYDHDPQSPPAPDWLSIKGQNSWKWRGLIVWRRKPEQIVCMQPGYAMKIIKDLQESTRWQKEGYTIGEWGVSFELDLKTKESKTSEPGLMNQMHLTSEQTAKLLTFIEAESDVIRQMSEEDRFRYEDAMDLLAQMILKDLRDQAFGS